MKEFKHTPGPWFVEEPNFDPEYGEMENPTWSIRAPGANGCISFELATLSGWDPDKDEHDARLIAAAPELLGALDEMLSLYGGPIDPDGRRKDDYELDSINRARAAISKALGATK